MMEQPNTSKTDSEKNTRAEKQKKKQSKKKNFAQAVLLCIIFGCIIFILCAFVLFKVDNITVEGLPDDFCGDTHKYTNSCYYSDDDIIRMCGVENGESLVMMSKKDVVENLTKRLPYLGSVEVKRQYPSTLKIVVEDTHAVYAVDAGGGYTLLDKNFKALERCEKIPDNCAKVIGVHLLSSEIGKTVQFEDENCKTRISSIEENCAKRNIKGITKIDIVNIANISFKIDNKYTVVLGVLTDLEDKFDAVAATIKAESEKNSNARKIINVVDPKRAYVGDDTSPLENQDGIITVG